MNNNVCSWAGTISVIYVEKTAVIKKLSQIIAHKENLNE